MKASDVVYSLKSLAAKLHPPLPLSPKESQRLLTALTSSFRRQLDAIHPHTLEDSSPAKQGPSRLHSHAIHASAAFADSHLASVLTNPLMVPQSQPTTPKLDHRTAKLELQRHPHRDPIDLLEKYHRKRAATVKIAELCLASFCNALKSLSEGAQQAEIARVQPGRRVLLWLSESNTYDMLVNVDDSQFTDLLVTLLIREGLEKSIWEWVKLEGSPDAALVSSLTGLDKVSTPSDRMVWATQMHAYQWRGYILRSMVRAKLASSSVDLDPGLDVFLNALRLAQSARPDDHLRWIPLSPMKAQIMRRIRETPKLLSDANPEKVDLFLAAIRHGHCETGAQYCSIEADIATLYLHHPTNPTIEPVYRFLQTTWSPAATKRLKKHLPLKALLFLRGFTSDVAAHFLAKGHNDEYEWLSSRTRDSELGNRLYPGIGEFGRHVQQCLQRVRESDKHIEDGSFLTSNTPLPTVA